MIALFASFVTSAYILGHEEKSFLSWMRETNNIFTGEEYQTRLGIWLSNSRLIQEHNSANLGFTLSMNHLAHLTPAEYKSLLGFKVSLAKRTAVKSNSVPNESVDWREKGIVNPAKNQGSCGSCWAFSAIQAVESGHAKAHGTLIVMSESNLVDCVTECYGCNGGLMDLSYDHVMKNQGGMFMKDSDYPYVARQGACKFDKSKGIGKITGYTNIVEGSEEDLAAKVSQIGVACIAIDASHYSFQLYSSGIYDEKRCSPTDLDHGVGCVGYGSQDGKNFWIVRNSWGAGWGEKGYIRMIKDKGNQCGEASMACVPIMA